MYSFYLICYLMRDKIGISGFGTIDARFPASPMLFIFILIDNFIFVANNEDALKIVYQISYDFRLRLVYYTT